MDLAVDTEGGAGADDLSVILTATFNDYDTVIIRGANPAHIVTVKNYVGGGDNIYLANGLDWSSNGNQNVLCLKKIGLNWYEEYRSPNLATTVASLRAAGLAVPVQGVQASALPTNGTINIEPGVNKGYYVITGSPTLIGSVVYQIQPSPATPYLNGDEVTVNYTATATPGVNNVTIFGITLTPTQVASGNVVVTTKYDLSNTTWYSTLTTKTNGKDLVDSVQLATKENYLGVPTIDGSVLSSLADGTRYWSAPTSSTATVEYSLTSSDILNLYSTPLQLVAAPGSGYAIEVLSAVFNYTFKSVAYATNTTLLLYTYNATNAQIACPGLISLGSSKIISSTSFTISTDSKTNGILADNLGLYLTVGVGNPTAGDGTLKVNVMYRVITV